jgi:hypothetical protein
MVVKIDYIHASIIYTVSLITISLVSIAIDDHHSLDFHSCLEVVDCQRNIRVNAKPSPTIEACMVVAS